ncbi:MAG: hypothetical protein PHN18_02205 [Sulfurospirillaceae bacterium]|nr:hypothetical protein [Sulfurospirillaceae bacterium]MDD2826605.1 hypothetical protein [Sulfurospirillaceae bacterium]
MNEILDIYVQDLLTKKELLQKCQQEKSLESCTLCERIFDCETRKAYVKAVYESMAKGQGGGFEF